MEAWNFHKGIFFVTFYLTNKIETAINIHDAETHGLSLSPNYVESHSQNYYYTYNCSSPKESKETKKGILKYLNSIKSLPFFIGIDHIGEDGSNIRTSADEKEDNDKKTLEIEESGLKEVDKRIKGDFTIYEGLFVCIFYCV